MNIISTDNENFLRTSACRAYRACGAYWAIMNYRVVAAMVVVFVLVLGCIIGAVSFAGLSQAELLPGMLKPIESETREIRSLDGLWNFRVAASNDTLLGFKQKWYNGPLSESGPVIDMPVPSSYNDITQEKEIRDHLGFVWYDRTFYVPLRWNDPIMNDSASGTRVWLRFGSVHYSAKVYINGNLSMTHDIGHLPFEADITNLLKFGEENRVTVSCDNTLRQDTVPQGGHTQLDSDHGPTLMQTYTFDFFNYAGIHRPVLLYTTPRVYISDVTISTNISGNEGIINYKIKYSGLENTDNEVSFHIEVYDQSGTFILNATADSNLSGSISIPEAKLWWPYLMHEDPGYMYTLKIILSTQQQQNIDVYRQLVGIRTISWTETALLINNKEIYLRGFGRHEDSDLRGKGLDLALLAKDYNLIKWVGANSYRTSHYPYSEEIMDMADRVGIMIIDECPSVDTESVVQHVKSLDASRPITLATNRGVSEDKAIQHVDIISFNHYYGWYTYPGRIDMITQEVIKIAKNWHNTFKKPVLMSEYGADTVEGLHISPDFVFSEEYQVEMMSKHFQAFDKLREEGFFIGEFIWNFADFKTAQSTTRVGGNKKGIFTRQRQPKAAAHHLRTRYHLLAEQIDKKPLEIDLFKYTIRENFSYRKNEL
uniref:Beta-glucuronidase n=1 Tax=Xenopsylla cheopis TaxID=163159 RepID=A0A6M2DP63_XENCH